MGRIERLEGGDWNSTDSGRRRVLLCVGRGLSSQEKIDISQSVVPGVSGPHGCKYLADRPKLLLHRPIPDGSPCGCQDYGTDVLGEDMEERGGFVYSLGIGRDM